MTTATKTAPKAKTNAEKAKSPKALKAKAQKALDTIDQVNDTLTETLAAATAAAEIEKAPKAKAANKPKSDDAPPKRSMLDAAAEVLATASEPMTCTALIDAMSERKLWTSPNGKTPEATLNAAMQREIKVKGEASRFRKAGRGLFAKKT